MHDQTLKPVVPRVTAPEIAAPLSLAALGWSDVFAKQIEQADAGLAAMRIATVHRARLTAISQDGPVQLALQVHTNTGDFAVGDWVLVEPETHLLKRRLERETILQRKIEGSDRPQLAGANIDTLFIVTSCNEDFNLARLERYLALANQAGTAPVILLTKADLSDDADRFYTQALALQRDLPVAILNPKLPDAQSILARWCGPGQTVAVVGSSGVGKSTLVNTLRGPTDEAPQETGGIREQDSKGRHTTTSRSIHAIAGGGWVIDTPGMRSLRVTDADYGLDLLFAEITELAPLCKFRDCTHAHEPGCAVRAAVEAGTLDADRLQRWRKLKDENAGKQTGRQTFRHVSAAGRAKRR